MTTTSTTNPTSAHSEVIRAAQRHFWDNEWLTSRQSFPATGNFDLIGNAHGMLMVNNDDIVDAAEGFDTHDHQDAEIITWVVDGALRHRDSKGNEGLLTPGVVQLMTAGTGIRHSEQNASTRAQRQSLRVVQMWVATEFAGAEPGYAERDFTADLADGTMIPVVSGRRDDQLRGAIALPNPHATLHAGRLPAGGSGTLRGARFGHLYVVKGSVTLGEESLGEGDAVRFTDTADTIVVATSDAEILYWEMDRGFGE